MDEKVYDELLGIIKRWNDDWVKVQKSIDETKQIPFELPMNQDELKDYIITKYKITKK